MSGPLDNVRLHLVDSLAALDESRRWLGQQRSVPLFFDTESAGLSPYHDKLRLVQLGDLTDGWAFPEGWHGAAVEMLLAYKGELGAHNHGYDWRVLNRWTPGGVRIPWHKTHDTLTMGHLVNSLLLAGLKERAEIEVDPRAARGQEVMREGMKANRWTWGTVPDRWAPYWTYGALDPVLSAHLFTKFAPAIFGKYREAYDLERAVIRICSAMMDKGMAVDIPFIEGKIAEINRFHHQATGWLYDTFGLDTVNSGPKVMAMLNQVGIPTQVLTESGNPSISKEALKFYATAYPEHAHLINTVRLCRKAGDLTGKYLGKFLDLQVDGIMHYSIWTCRARTSRMSVTDPPMQTYDRDEPVVRGAYIPREGFKLASMDADQVEMRLTAHSSQDPQLIQDFYDAERLGQSFFILAAGRIFREEISKKDLRYARTKNASYGQVYGSGLEKAAATAGVPVEEMRGPYYGFQQRYPRVKAYMNALINKGKYQGQRYAKIIDGRQLQVRRGHEYAILNTEIQGNAAVIMKRDIVALDAAGFTPYMCLPVHDELLFEFPESDAQRMLDEAVAICTDRTGFRVPITWAGSVLDHRWVKT